MKNYVGIAVLLALVTGTALMFRAIAFDIQVHDHYLFRST
jgi:hypothetical protein